MTTMNEILKTAYGLGVRQALLDSGYDEKTAENMMENVTKEMTPTVPNQFNPVIGLGEKSTEKKALDRSDYLPGVAAGLDPFVLGPVAGAATAPKGERWRRALGVGVGGIGGGLATEAVAHRLGANPKLQLLLALLGAGLGGQLGSNIAAKD